MSLRTDPGSRSEARRLEIIDSATLVFSEAGYRSASYQEIAELSGVSAREVRKYFPLPEDLLIAVLDHRDEVDDARMVLDSSTGIQALRRLLELATLNESRRRLVELFLMMSAEAADAGHAMHPHFAERYRRLLAGVERAYERAAAEGTLQPGVDPRFAAPQLMALMDGLQLQWLLSDGHLDMAATLRRHLQSQVTEAL